jgi:hypothetical protein
MLGDAIAKVATPIARAFGLNCIDPQTNDLRPESPCAQRKRMLNEGRYADFLFNRIEKEKAAMRFRLTSEIEAETLEEALANKAQAKVLSINPAASVPTQQVGAANRTTLSGLGPRQPEVPKTTA